MTITSPEPAELHDCEVVVDGEPCDGHATAWQDGLPVCTVHKRPVN